MFRSIQRFFSKAMIPLSDFTDSERKLLTKVFLDPLVAQHFKWKRYLTNEEIKLAGDDEVNIIGWENFKVKNGSFKEARDLAKTQQLDTVLVCKRPATVRIMNYKNWILQWAFQDNKLKGSSSNKKNSPIFHISHRINEQDLLLKVQKVKESLEKHEIVTVESSVSNNSSFEELAGLRKFEANFLKKFKASTTGKAVEIKVNSGELQSKIVIRKIGKQKGISSFVFDLNEPLGEKIVYEGNESTEFDDEEEYMRGILSGSHDKFRVAKKEIENKNKEVRRSFKSTSENDIYQGYNDPDEHDAVIDKELEEIKQKITDLVGESLAMRFLRGRLRLR